jgi:beta-lactamase class D
MKAIALLVLILVIAVNSIASLSLKMNNKNYFPEMKGCFVLYNMKTKTFDKVIGRKNCEEQFPACSTFKVPLAVMAFDSGVLKDENQILKWDGIKGVRDVTNQDHNAKTWIRDSVVWFSQRITPLIGEKKLQKYLNDFKYGNKNISTGITEAWLVSPSDKRTGLKLSAYEQIDFMKKLWTDQLPVTKDSMRITRELTFLENSPKGFKLSGKTGSGFYDKDHKVHLGWFVSHLKNKNQEYIVVSNLSDLKPVESNEYGGTRAKAVTKKILTDLGLW